LAFWPQDDPVAWPHLDRIESFGENSQLSAAPTAHDAQYQRHRADQEFLAIGYRQPR
jgi:hypothetical protein